MEEIKRIYFLSRAPIFFIGLMTLHSLLDLKICLLA